MTRTDKWLWGARLYKTRSLANAAIGSGHVRVNGHRIKPAKLLAIGDEITINRGQGNEITLLVLNLDDNRVGYPIASLRYEETAQSIEKNAARQAAAKAGLVDMPHPKSKPDKKQRRQLIALRQKK